MVEEVKDLGKEFIKDTKEVVIERFFSPMYFYFILAWIIYNWTFVYSLLFVDSTKFKKYKLDYLLSFYTVNDTGDFFLNLWYLFVGPAVSTYILIWWISKLSEYVYEKFENYKSNKVVIKRKIEYQQIRAIESEKKKSFSNNIAEDEKIKYEDNPEFNEWFDDLEDFITISGINYAPSRVLYNTDYSSYIAHINDFENEKKENEVAEQAK